MGGRRVAKEDRPDWLWWLITAGSVLAGVAFLGVALWVLFVAAG
jgi:hypothetical protein